MVIAPPPLILDYSVKSKDGDKLVSPVSFPPLNDSFVKIAANLSYSITRLTLNEYLSLYKTYFNICPFLYSYCPPFPFEVYEKRLREEKLLFDPIQTIWIAHLLKTNSYSNMLHPEILKKFEIVQKYLGKAWVDQDSLSPLEARILNVATLRDSNDELNEQVIFSVGPLYDPVLLYLSFFRKEIFS